VDAERFGIGISLFGLTLLLAGLAVRGVVQFARTRSRPQLMWGSGLALAAAAVAIEAVVYSGYVNGPLLQAYVVLSAAIVGVLSLGATRILTRPRLEAAYTAWTLGSCAAVAAVGFATPIPTDAVAGGIISGALPTNVLLVSSLVTGPATVLLLAASYLSLRRNFRWQTVLMAAGAVILGAGGTLYIASFPVALYYAEFLGILCLFLGLVSLPASAARHLPTAVAERAP